MKMFMLVCLLALVGCSDPATLVVENLTGHRVVVAYGLHPVFLDAGETYRASFESGVKAVVGATDEVTLEKWGPSLIVLSPGSTFIWRLGGLRGTR